MKREQGPKVELPSDKDKEKEPTRLDNARLELSNWKQLLKEREQAGDITEVEVREKYEKRIQELEDKIATLEKENA